MTVQTVTRCLLCGAELKSEPLPKIEPGKPADMAVVNFVLKLYKHLEKDHPKQYSHVNASVQQFMGYVTLTNFDVQDPVLIQSRDSVRAAIAPLVTP